MTYAMLVGLLAFSMGLQNGALRRIGFLKHVHTYVTGTLLAIRKVREIFRAAPVAHLMGPEIMPGPDLTSDAQLDQFIRDTTTTAYHPVGTCAMGIDANAVVDAQLRVRGIAGLRVADASIMPTITGGNTNAPTVMIGDKASDLILGKALPRAELGPDRLAAE